MLMTVVYRTLCAVLVVLFLCVGSAGAASIHVVPHINAQGLVPVIEPLLGDEGFVRAYRGRLVISANDRVFKHIQSLLQQLPAAPPSVTVYLRRNNHQIDRGGGVRLTGNGIAVNAGISRQHGRSVYSVTTLAGQGAHITHGSLVALVGGDDLALARLQQGIWVVPSVTAGGRVRLSIRQRYDRYREDDRITTQGAGATLLLEPGQWQSLGRLRSRQHTGNAGLGGIAGRSERMMLPLQVKVEVH